MKKNHVQIMITRELKKKLEDMREFVPSTGSRKKASFSELIDFLMRKNEEN